MLSNLFISIEGLSSENLATQILAYILSNSSYATQQRIIYNIVFDDNELKDTHNRRAGISTQEHFEHFGRPDLIVDSPNDYAIIENKFWANFSKGDQFIRYAKLLESLETAGNKHLILLCIKSRLPSLQENILSQYKAANETYGDIDALMSHLKSISINLKFILWEDIIEKITGSGFVVDSFVKFIKSRFLHQISFSEEALGMINSQKIPELLDLLWEGVDQVRFSLNSQGYSTDRMSQSRGIYGFSLKQPFGSLWIGLYFLPWKKYNTPYVIMFRKEWISDDYPLERVQDSLISNQFKADSDLEYVYPIYFSGKLIIDEIMPIITDVISKVNNRMAE